MDKLDAEEKGRYPSRTDRNDSTDSSKKTNSSGKTTNTDASSDITTTTSFDEVKDKDGIGDLLNDMPLFNEFKTSLMDAFRSMDGATSGSSTS